MSFIDITGNKYNRLSVVGLDRLAGKRSFWVCKCDCGKTVTLRKDHFAYKYSHQKSCGCLRSECSSQRMTARHEKRRRGRGLCDC